jgi:broad specificity phosphatase PhoE
MAIYFLRHGESLANVECVFAGQKNDSPLSEKGFEQARLAANDIKSLGISRMIMSSLMRSRQTATEVAKVIGFNEDTIEIDDRITEYDMGSITGTPIRKVTSLELVSAEGAEDPVKFRERILSFLKEYKNSPEDILVVSHAGVDRMIQASKLNMDPKQFYSLPPLPNAHAIKLDLDWLI